MWSFDTDGIVRLEGALSRADAEAMADAVWRFVERKTEHRRDDRSTWIDGQPLLSFKTLRKHSAFNALMKSTAVRASLDDVFGADAWPEPKPGGQILMTFPNATEWSLPSSGWHMDTGFGRPSWPTYGVKLFALLTDIEPGGGATLALAGTHQLVHEYTQTLEPSQLAGNMDAMAKFLRTVGILEELKAGSCDRVVEMCGQAGDVFLTHVHTLHCVAPNAAATPRMMLGKYVAAA